MLIGFYDLHMVTLQVFIGWSDQSISPEIPFNLEWWEQVALIMESSFSIARFLCILFAHMYKHNALESSQALYANL